MPDDRRLEDSPAPPEEDEQVLEPVDEGEDGERTPRRRRRWFGRRREAVVEPEVQDEPDEATVGPDWNSVITDYRVGGQWLDWSAQDPPAGGSPSPEAPPSADAAPSDAEAAHAEAGVPEAAAAPAAADTRDETVAVWETAAEPAGAEQTAQDATADVPSAGGAGDEEEPRRYRSTPSWPPPPRPRIGLGILCGLIVIVLVVLLVTNGNIGLTGRETSSESATGRPALQTDPDSVPRDWIVYRHSGTDFGVSYPPGWTVREEGGDVRIQDPLSGAELHIDHQRRSGDTDPEQSWLAEERTASTRLGEYRRLQLSPASYLGHKAALWEYTHSDGTQFRHTADLEFVTDDERFRLHFEARSSEWERLLPVFRGFLSSFRTPE